MVPQSADQQPQDPSGQTVIPAEMRAAFAKLRSRIRAYVTIDGIATAVIWVAATFWIAFALDYLPILVGATELPQAVRAFMLVAILVVLAVILYRQVLRRVLVRLADRSMAILLERRYRGFRDSLVTTVELANRRPTEADYNPQLLKFTSGEALRELTEVRLGNLFNLRPLVIRLLLAVLLVGSLIGLAAVKRDTFTLAARRLWLIDPRPWPRSARIEVVGIEVQRPAGAASALTSSPLLSFQAGPVKVARGASFNLRVLADANAAVVPESCTIFYRSSDGDRGRVPMKRIGRERSEQMDGAARRVQWYAFDGKPFKGILSSVEFDVVGYDHRVGSYAVQVVDSPTVTETKLDCVFPEYLVDEKTASWLPRTIDYLPSGTQLPRGTQFTLKVKTNKPLQRVVIHNPDKDETVTLDVSGTGAAAQEFSHTVAAIDGNTTFEISLLDQDQVFSERPHRVVIAAVPDEAPKVDVRLAGIGTAVTPDVLVPTRGKVEDDYGIAKTWLELQVNDRQSQNREFLLGPGGKVDTEVDFRELRSEPMGWELKPQDKLRIRVSAQDRFKLGEAGPNVGGGELYELEVVTSEELLRLLEARELGLRRRFEQIIEEVTELRDSLLRVKTELVRADSTDKAKDEKKDSPAAKDQDKNKDQATAAGQNEDQAPAEGKPAADKPADGKPADGASDEGELGQQTAAERAQTLRLLRVQRASQQSMKSAGEVLGVAVSFEDIREELVNNRVDTEDRKNRLKEQISDPLKKVVQGDFPELDRKLAELEKALLDSNLAFPAADQSAQQADLVLNELNTVLQNMLDLETFNELLDIVRSLIKEQNEVIDRTKLQKKKQLLDLTQ
ncbi:MAG: hypothetical protein ACKOBW_15240 [Planctomycetota bacterium]